MIKILKSVLYQHGNEEVKKIKRKATPDEHRCPRMKACIGQFRQREGVDADHWNAAFANGDQSADV